MDRIETTVSFTVSTTAADHIKVLQAVCDIAVFARDKFNFQIQDLLLENRLDSGDRYTESFPMLNTGDKPAGSDVVEPEADVDDQDGETPPVYRSL